ncbi:MAG: hypothetical protein GWN01_14065 [Nitrosopumilaceae archaeon]|nr:hypothetical protein [Nitrosopumilaceae archaeon]NIU01985.1 hypothetical protein [Nitrosopumilaceae archaeon]NIU87136.1 hypothetical protein [Nitrosopumilaceae archaeon]NIV64626.1 hypothetical protein [Nitrosopumilaceae archaeon]NIX62586.1 hypothetical protein [Nitrosopumilaceae archaeon]
MKAIVGILVLLVIIGFIPVNAQTTLEFGYQQHPQKLLENTEGTIQIYPVSDGNVVPVTIDGLKVSSSDNTILQITDVIQNDDFSNAIKVIAKQPGSVNLSLAAPGFKSQQIPVTVYTNNNHPTQILLKTTPNDFPVDGPKFGYVGVELATTGNLPTIAPKDIEVNISTPNNDIISLHESKIKIPKGEYYALTKFDVRSSGDAIIFAESEGMKKVSNFIHVREAKTPLQLQLYVFPKNFNSFNSQIGYAIIQLQDAEGVPVKSDRDIHLKIGVENPDSGINISHDFEEFLFETKELVIREGKYSTFTSFSVRPNISTFTDDFEQTYNFFITADNYISKGDSLKITHDEIGTVEGKGPAITETVPFLTTGEKEILGVSYFETDVEVSRKQGTSTIGVTDRERATITVPVMASEDLKVSVTSSNLGTVDAEDALFKKGKNAAIIFGNTGTVIPDKSSSLEFYVTDNKKTTTVTGTPEGPEEDNLSLTVETLIPKILANSKFPIIGYLIEAEDEDDETSTSTGDDEEENGRIGVTHFIRDSVLTFSANENFEVPADIISQNQEYSVVTAHAHKLGTSALTAQATGLEAQLNLQSHTTDPTQVLLSYPNNILPGTTAMASIQVLDSVGNPVYTKTPIKFEIVSNNQDSIRLPETIIMDKGEYFKSFEIDTVSEGKADISILAEDLPMEDYEFVVKGFNPEITLNAPNSVDAETELTAELSVKYVNNILAVENLNVEWNVLGGEIIQHDSVTNKDGIAKATIMPKEAEELEISASVNGIGFTNIKTEIKSEIVPVETTEPAIKIEEKPKSLISREKMMLFAIPGAAGAAFFYLKKSNRLEGISERLNITEKLDDIKEKVSEIRER